MNKLLHIIIFIFNNINTLSTKNTKVLDKTNTANTDDETT